MSRFTHPVPPEKTMIQAGWVIDGKGQAPIADQWITIEDGHITAMAPAPMDLPPAIGALDFTHATLLPALMDSHVHLALSGTQDAAARSAQLENDPQKSHQLILRHLKQHLQCGIAAVRDGGDKQASLIGFRQRAVRPHIAAAGWAWHSPGRYGGMIGRPLDDGMVGSNAFANALKGVDHIKLIQSGLNSLDHFGRQSAPQFSTERLHAIAAMAAKVNLPLMIHANGKAAVATAIDAGCSSIEHGYFMGKENIKRMADLQIVWVPTAIPMAALAHHKGITGTQADIAQKTLDHQLAQIDFAHQQGVPIALGTDAGAVGVHHGSAVAAEIGLYIEAGIALSEAIRCATWNNGKLMGLEDQGILEPGWRANLIAVPGTPDELPKRLHQIEAVWMDGKRYI